MKTFKQFFCENNLQIQDSHVTSTVQKIAEICHLQLIEPKLISSIKGNNIIIVAERENILRWPYECYDTTRTSKIVFDYAQSNNKLVLALVQSSKQPIRLRMTIMFPKGKNLMEITVQGMYLDFNNIDSYQWQQIIASYQSYEGLVNQYRQQLTIDDISGIFDI